MKTHINVRVTQVKKNDMKPGNLDDILKNKFRDYEPESGVPSWERMKKRMAVAENESGTPLVRPRYNTLKRVGIAAAVLIVAGLGFYLYNNSIDPELVREGEQVLSSKMREIPEISISNTPAIEQIISSARRISVIDQTADQRDGVVIASYDSLRIAGNETQEESEPEQATPPSESRTLDRVSRSPYTGYTGGSSFGQTDVRTKRSGSGWQLAAFTSGSISSESRSSGSSPTMMMLSAAGSEPGIVEVNYVNHVFNVSKDDLKHKFPVSVGLSVRKNITPRFGLETGLVYSFLESTAKLDGLFRYRYEQNLHYLGIPVNAYYNIIDKNRLNLYVSGGIMGEIALSAKATTKIYDGDRFSSETRGKLAARGVLWSMGASVGFGYDLVDNFGIYVEPGFSYYFKNDKHPVSYRTDNPVSFSLRAGLRYKF